MSVQQTTLTGINPDVRVYSIGYGGRTLVELIKKLSDLDVEMLIDVRSSPNTKWMGRQMLEERLGKDYISIPELGGKDYSPHEYSRWYTNTPNRFFKSLAELSEWHIICLLCAEKDHLACHRYYFVARMLKENYGISVKHL